MTEPSSSRKLAAILSADVVGYSRLMQADDEATVATLKEYRAAVARIIARHNGRVVNAPGDSILAEFRSAQDAVSAAVDVQHDVEGRNRELPEERQMHFRIGVNLGDVIEEDDGTLYGDGVNIAARMEALAEGGGICVSSTVYDAITGKLALGFDFLGEQQVKNIAQPVRVYRVRAEPRAADSAPVPARRRWPLYAGAGAALAVLIALGAWLFLDRLTPVFETADQPSMAIPALPSGPSIAVLPFANLSGDREQDYFADGITEEIISRLSRFRELLVFARASTQAYKSSAPTPQDVRRDLGAQFVLEGSIRRADERLRVSARLIETETGLQRWSETYDRALHDIFALQDEITDKIVGAIGGSYSAIVGSRATETAARPAQSFAAYDLAMRAWMYYAEESPERHARARADAERAAEIEPGSAFVQAVLAYMYLDEVRFDFSPRPDSLDRALAAARRAVDLDPRSAVAQSARAIVRFHRGELDQFLNGCDEVIALNPNAAEFVAECGEKMIQTGLIDRGAPLMRRARAINPRHPPWYGYIDALVAFDRGDYEAALAAVSAVDEPDFYAQWQYRAAYNAALGRQAEAEAAVEQLLRIDPEWSIAKVIDFRGRVWQWPQERLDRFAALLRQAGLPEGAPTN